MTRPELPDLEGPLAQIPPSSRWYHAKTDRVYIALNVGLLEATLEPVVIYTMEPWQSGPHVTWVRPVEEFLDGRFKRIR